MGHELHHHSQRARGDTRRGSSTSASTQALMLNDEAALDATYTPYYIGVKHSQRRQALFRGHCLVDGLRSHKEV